MCIDFDGHHSSGSSFVYVNDFCYYRNCLYTYRYKFSSDKEQVNESPSIEFVTRTRFGSAIRVGSGSWRDKLVSEPQLEASQFSGIRAPIGGITCILMSIIA